MKHIRNLTTIGLLTGLCLAALASEPVKTESGLVQGTSGKNPTVSVYRGIPYAAPPVGKLRWAPPQPASHWQEIRKGDEFGARCYQNPVYNDMIFRDKGPSEDCLFLNVWTPSNSKPGARLPVFFWLHGGGYESGSGDEPRYDGESFAAQGIVVVSINYRIGVLGYFAHPDLAKESARHAMGNYGLLDMVAALKWVHQNIAAFGGDPAHVTIGGESAGSMAVSALMASPLTKGLYAAAIGESGAVFTPKPTTYFRTVTPQVAASRSEDWMKAAKASSLDELRARPAEELVKISFRGIVNEQDGLVLDRNPLTVYQAGDEGHVPVLLGWNSEEAKSKQKATVESHTAMVKAIFKDDATEALKYFPAKDDAEANDSTLVLQSDLFTVYPTWQWAQFIQQNGHAEVYRYLFSRSVPGAPGAVHASEIEYVFNALDSKPNVAWTDGDRELATAMNTYWGNFIRTLNPNGKGLPVWPSYSGGKVMQLNLECIVISEPNLMSQKYLQFYTFSH